MKNNTIVTHLAPDVDAVASVWLIKRFMLGWEDADVAFVPAGKTLNNESPDSNPTIHHVDTGMGMLDHHQTSEDTCAARRVLEYLMDHPDKAHGKHFPDEALIRLVDVVNDIDHFREVYFPNPSADFYDFSLVGILDGLRLIFPNEHNKVVDFSLMALDGIYRQFKNKVWAQEEIKNNGIVFETKFGKGLALESLNDETVRIAQRQGYTISLRKDPKKGFIRLKALPQSDVDFTIVYEELKRKDPAATWFLHAGKKMVLNGSVKNPDSKPSTLPLKEVMEIVKEKLT